MAEPSNQNPAALADELLAIRCQLGEPDAFAALVDRWHEPLWLYLRRVTGDDDTAADAVQDVWLRVLRALPSLRDPARLRSWLFGIAHRTLMDRLRRRYAEPESEAIDPADLAAPEPAPGRAEELELMHEALARMPLLEREVLVLFYLDELSIDQLATTLGIPEGTVKSRLFRARRLLRRELTANGVDP